MKKKRKISVILGIDDKLYKVKAVIKHPYIAALINMCNKVDMKEIYRSGRLSGSEGVVLAAKFKKYKEALPPQNRRYTAAQLEVIKRLLSFKPPSNPKTTRK